MSSKKAVYKRAFGGGTDNLWETVDTIMVDLVTHQMPSDGNNGVDGEEIEKSTSTNKKKKDEELEGMMEHLDNYLDDLQDISSISNDTNTASSSSSSATRRATINTSAEKLKPNKHDEFLEKENPFDSITQGLLYQTGDVPLFASSDQVPQTLQASSDEDEYEEDDGEYASDGEPNGFDEDEDSQGVLEQPGEHDHVANGARPRAINRLARQNELSSSAPSRYFESAKQTEENRKMAIKDRIAIYQELSKVTEAQQTPPTREHKIPTSTTPSTAHHSVIFPSSSYRSRPFSSSPAVSNPHLPTSHSSSPPPRPPRPNAPGTKEPDSSSSPLLFQESPTPASPKSPRALPPIPTTKSPHISRANSQRFIKEPSLTLTNPPSPAQKPKHHSTVPGNSFQLDQAEQSTKNRTATDSIPIKARLNSILTNTATPPMVPSPLLSKSKRNKKTITEDFQKISFSPSQHNFDPSGRSQINIGVRSLKVSTDSASPPSSPLGSPLLKEHSALASPPTSPPLSPRSSSSARSSISPRSMSPPSTSPPSVSPPSTSPRSTSPTATDTTNAINIPTPLNLSDSGITPDAKLQRDASLRRVLSSPLLRAQSQHAITARQQHLSVQRTPSQNALTSNKPRTRPRVIHPPPTNFSATTPPVSSSPPSTAKKSLRMTPVGQHRTPSRLVFGGDGISVHARTKNSGVLNGSTGAEPAEAPEQSSTPTATSPLATSSNGTPRRPPSFEAKERNAKIKQLRDLMRRYRSKLAHMEAKHSREALELSTRITTAMKEATMHVKTYLSWGQNVLTKACRNNWQLKVFVYQCRYDLHHTQAALLQAKLELVDQLMHLLEIEYKSTSTPKNDFVIYSSFFKDPSEVMTNPEVEHLTRVIPILMRLKRQAKLEHHRLRVTYQPEPLDRRIRRVRDILARLHPSPLLSSYYIVDDTTQLDFDALVTDQRLLEGRHILHLKNFLQDDLAGDRSITPAEIADFLQQFAQKMTETFGVNQQDTNKLLLLCKRAIYPRIYHLLIQGVPESVDEQDKQLASQLTWLNELPDVVLRDGLKLDKRPFQGPNPAAAFEPAIDALNDLAFLIVPTEMCVAVHKAFKLTHDITLAQVKAHGGPGAEMGMDDVFPVFLWVVTQCNVARLCRCVYFMDFFSDTDEKISALGYAATSLAAAVSHLSQIEKEIFIPAPVVP